MTLAHFWHTNHTPIQPQAVVDKENLISICLLSSNEQDDDFNDEDAWVMKEEDIIEERDAFDVFVDEDNDL